MGRETAPSGDADAQAADFAAQWQAEHPGGAQVDISYDADSGSIESGPAIYADGEGEP